MAHRADAIYPATVVGKPRQEDFFIGDLLQDLLSPLFPLVMPAVEQLWSYGETGYHSLAAAVVKQRYSREAMASAFRILGEGQLSLTKFLLVTDRGVDVRDFKATLEHVLARTHPGDRPLRVLEPVDGHARLHGSGGEPRVEGRVARARRSGARPARGASPARRRPGVRDVRVFCRGCLVVEVPSHADEPGVAARLAADPAFAEWPLVVLTDDAARAARSDMNFLWTTFTRFEPAADIHSGIAADRAQPHRLRVPDRDRCAAEARAAEGAVVRRRDRRAGDAPLEGVLPDRRPSRWATRSGRTWTERRRG